MPTMKLVIVLMLVAVPLCCYAGGCTLFQDFVNKTTDKNMTTDEYVKSLQKYAILNVQKTAMDRFKQCYLQQSQETIDDYQAAMNRMFDSPICKVF